MTVKRNGAPIPWADKVEVSRETLAALLRNQFDWTNLADTPADIQAAIKDARKVLGE